MAGLFRYLFPCFRPPPSECVFCKIAKEPEGDSEFVYQDDTFVAFEDIRPAARLHFLVIPRAHVASVKALRKDDVPLLKEMEKVGISLMDKFNVPDDERRMGFHIPPFNSVDHLHLHVHALPYKSAAKAMKYPSVKGSGSNYKGFVWFAEVRQAIRILESGRRIGVLPC